MKKHILLAIFALTPILVSTLFAGSFIEDVGSQYGLQKLLKNPTAYEMYLGRNFGSYQITDAYRTTQDTIAIKYTYKNGVVILKDYDRKTNTFLGLYKTDRTVGEVTLSFNLDGTASGSWETIFIGGPMQIMKKSQE